MKSCNIGYNQKPHPYKKIIPHYLITVLLITIGILVYYRSLNGPFLFDDTMLLINNPFIKSFSYIKDIFTTQIYQGSGEYSNSYRPIQSLSLMLDYRLWKLNPFGYHLTNVGIHILNCIGAYFLIYLVSKKRYVATITGLLFCVHTVLSGVVNYVSARSDLLCMLFFLTSMSLYILYRRGYFKGYGFILYSGSLIAFLISLLSKEMAFVFPFVFLFYLYCFSKEEEQLETRRPNLIWIFFIVIAVHVCLRLTILDFTKGRLLETTTGQFPLYIRLLTMSKVFILYLRLLFLPLGLHMEWDIKPANSIFQPEIFLSMLGISIIGIFAYLVSQRSKLKFFAIGWFFITLLPYSNIYPITYFMGEGWLYIPSIGFFALVAVYLSEIRERSYLWRLIVNSVVILAVIFYGLLSIKRADVWADPIRFYTEILKYSPKDFKIIVNLGNIYKDLGKTEEVVALYKKALEINPDYVKAYNNLGVIYDDLGRTGEAVALYKKALEVDPNNAMAYNNLGIVYNYIGKREEAITLYKKAIEINPNYTDAYNNLGVVYNDLGRTEEAIALYKKAIDINPDYPTAYNNLGNIYSDIGDKDEAIALYKKAITINPNLIALYLNLGIVYNGLGKKEEAVKVFNKALEINPNYAEAYYNLSVIYFNGKQYDLAIEYCDKAVELGFKVSPEFLEKLEPYRK